MTLRTSWLQPSDQAFSDLSADGRRVSGDGCAVRDQESRNIASVRVAQLEIRHGCGDGVGLGVLQPRINPLPRGLVGDVIKRWRIVSRLDCAAVGEFDGVTMHAAISPEQIAARG